MNFNQIFQFQLPTLVIHGYNSIFKVGEEAKKLGLKRVLLVTDQGIRKARLLEGAISSLEKANLSLVIFDEVEEDPGTKTVEKGTKLLKENGCEGVVVVGGGSPLCAGKGIALLAANGGSIADYEGVGKYKNPPLPVIGIPTTAGSGSEVSAMFIITDEKRNYKMSIGGDACYPEVAILDPLLLKNIPFKPGVYAGIDALSHALEALWTNLATPLTDALAFAAIQMIMENLAPSVLTEDLEAKYNQLLASTMANIACGNAKLGLVHALSQPLGRYHLAHGLVNGILLPYVMEFNLPACERKLALVALSLGEKEEMSQEELARRAILRVKELYLKLDFPRKLPEEVVKKEDIPELAKIAMGRSQVKVNIRKSREEELAHIFYQALKGWEL